MKNRLFIFTATIILLASHVSAGTVGSTVPFKSWSWVGTISGGGFWAKGGNTQSINQAEEVFRTFATRKANNFLVAGELFAGIQTGLTERIKAQLGLALATTGSAKMQGEIWEDEDPEFNNYLYQYKVQHNRVALKAKILMDKGYKITPWVSASAGIGYNRAYSFTNNPTIFEALPTSNFNNKTQTALAYTLGIGLQKNIDTHWQIGLGYEFANWGKNELARSPEQTVGSGLHLGHLYTNGILLSLTYNT